MMNSLALLNWIQDGLVMKTKEFRVQENRFLFKCPYCGEKRNFTILDIRSKKIECSDCRGITTCLFNRRPEQRERLSGMLTLRTIKNTEIEVMMRDISARGIGFEVRKGFDLRLIKLSDDISLSCNWSPTLIPKSRFRVQNINGFRVGVMTIMKIMDGNLKSVKQQAK